MLLAVLTTPFNTALVPDMIVAGCVVAPAGGSATSAMDTSIVRLFEVGSIFSPAASGLVFTITGTGLLLVLLLPRSPSLLSPQVTMVPSVQRAEDELSLEPPAPIATTVLPDRAETPLTVFTATGTERLVVVLSPSWP